MRVPNPKNVFHVFQSYFSQYLENASFSRLVVYLILFKTNMTSKMGNVYFYVSIYKAYIVAQIINILSTDYHELEHALHIRTMSKELEYENQIDKIMF